MNKFKSAAIKVLKEAGTPLHTKEITRIALEKGYLVTDGKTPEASMSAQLVTEVNALGEGATFIKTAPATFALKSKKRGSQKRRSRN